MGSCGYCTLRSLRTSPTRTQCIRLLMCADLLKLRTGLRGNRCSWIGQPFLGTSQPRRQCTGLTKSVHRLTRGSAQPDSRCKPIAPCDRNGGQRKASLVGRRCFPIKGRPKRAVLTRCSGMCRRRKLYTGPTKFAHLSQNRTPRWLTGTLLLVFDWLRRLAQRAACRTGCGGKCATWAEDAPLDPW